MIEEELIFTQRESTKLGNPVENYFYLKLKKCVKVNEDFIGFYSINDHISKIKDCIFRYVKEKTKTESKEADKIKIAGFNLIKRAEDIFPTNSKKIKIDSFFPSIYGKTVKIFYSKVDEYSYSSENFINSIKDENYYNLIVESTHNITSNLNKKESNMKDISVYLIWLKSYIWAIKRCWNNFMSIFWNILKSLATSKQSKFLMKN